MQGRRATCGSPSLEKRGCLHLAEYSPFRTNGPRRSAVKNRTSNKINSSLTQNCLWFCGLWASPRISTDMSASRQLRSPSARSECVCGLSPESVPRDGFGFSHSIQLDNLFLVVCRHCSHNQFETTVPADRLLLPRRARNSSETASYPLDRSTC